MKRSEQIHDLAAALARAQAAIKGASKDKDNPFFKSKYADLESVWEACRDPLCANELSVCQCPEIDGECVAIETLLMHSSGQWVSSLLALPLQKNDPQGIGSAITYGRRYALAAMVGVAPEDDDAEGAMVRNGDKKQQPKKQDTKKPPQDKSQPMAKETLDKAIDKIKGAEDFEKLSTSFNWADEALANGRLTKDQHITVRDEIILTAQGLMDGCQINSEIAAAIQWVSDNKKRMTADQHDEFTRISAERINALKGEGAEEPAGVA